jgi:glycosyltransferase involved in cell wall biosynthesis
MRILWIGKTGDANAWYHVYPFVASPGTRQITVVRPGPLQRPIQSEKLSLVYTGSRSLARDLFSFVRVGARTLRQKDFDVVVTFGLVPWGFLAWTLAKLFRKPIVLGLIGTDFHRHVRSGPFSPLLRYALRTSDAVTVPGTTMREEVAELLGKSEHIKVFPHCLPDDALTDRATPTQRAFNLITVAALTANKRTIDVLEAVRILARDTDVTLSVLGTGSELGALRSYAREHGLEERVTFHGHVSEVQAHLDRATCYVQASLEEGLSLGLVEAMGRDLIPVTTVAGSERDLIRDDVNGLFVGKRNPEQLAERIRFALAEENFSRLLVGVRDTKELLRTERAVSMVSELQGVL